VAATGGPVRRPAERHRRRPQERAPRAGHVGHGRPDGLAASRRARREAGHRTRAGRRVGRPRGRSRHRQGPLAAPVHGLPRAHEHLVDLLGA